MILIVDSGSTKCDWLAINREGVQVLEKQRTKGLNPAILPEEKLRKRINKNRVLIENSIKVSHLFFYGAGCGTEKPREQLKLVLEDIFPNATVSVKEDTYAAVYSTIAQNNEAAVVCILGTGSNCSYFDGENLHQRVKSLGYTLMDDASGNYYGKQILKDHAYGRMPKQLAEKFESQYDLSRNLRLK